MGPVASRSVGRAASPDQAAAAGSSENGIVRHRAEHIDHVWSYDFVSDQTIDGRRLKILTVEDEFTRQCQASEVGRTFARVGMWWVCCGSCS